MPCKVEGIVLQHCNMHVCSSPSIPQATAVRNRYNPTLARYTGTTKQITSDRYQTEAAAG